MMSPFSEVLQTPTFYFLGGRWTSLILIGAENNILLFLRGEHCHKYEKANLYFWPSPLTWFPYFPLQYNIIINIFLVFYLWKKYFFEKKCKWRGSHQRKTCTHFVYLFNSHWQLMLQPSVSEWVAKLDIELHGPITRRFDLPSPQCLNIAKV